MVIDNDDAVQAMRGLAVEHRAFTETDLVDLHRRILRRSVDQSEPLASLFDRIDDAQSTEAAFEAQARLIEARLFQYGNGRLARLTMNLILLRGGWLLMPIWPSHAAEYRHVGTRLRDARSAATSATRAAHHRFLRARLIDACKAYLRVVESEPIEE